MTTDPKALADFVEDGCRAVYGRTWDGPPEKMPGDEMKAVWRNLVRKAQEPVLAALCAASSAEAMRKALKPFADVAERFEDWGEPGYANIGLTLKIVTRDDEEENLRVGDLWRARAALSPDPGSAPVEEWRWVSKHGKPRTSPDHGGEEWLLTWSENSATYDVACIDGEWGPNQEVSLLGVDAYRWLANFPPPPAEPSRDAQEEPDPWPAGCIKPGSCGRHEQCMYAMSVEKCRHYGRNLAEDVHAHRKPALAAARQEGGEHD